MAVTRTLSELKVNDRLNYVTISLDATKFENLWNTSFIRIEYSILLEGGSYTELKFVIVKNIPQHFIEIQIYLDSTWQWSVGTSNGSTIAYSPSDFQLPYTCEQLGKITSVSATTTGGSLTSDTDCLVFSNINRTYYGLFRRMVLWLQRRHSQLDYYMSLCSTAITPSFTSAKGTYSTVSSADARLIGNYLCLDFRASMTSSQYNSIGTGDITNTTMGTMTFSDFYYGPDTIDTLTTNADRQNKIYGIQPQNVSALSAYSTGNAHVGQWSVNAETSGHTLTIEFILCSLQGKTSQIRCICWLPVHRCPWIRES